MFAAAACHISKLLAIAGCAVAAVVASTFSVNTASLYASSAGPWNCASCGASNEPAMTVHTGMFATTLVFLQPPLQLPHGIALVKIVFLFERLLQRNINKVSAAPMLLVCMWA
jgi:hypothetical protein